MADDVCVSRSVHLQYLQCVVICLPIGLICHCTSDIGYAYPLQVPDLSQLC